MTDSEMERLLKTVETKTLTEEVEKTTHGCFAPLPLVFSRGRDTHW